MLTKQKGDMAVGRAIAYFLAHDYEVCLPIGDKRDYDLVIEKADLLERVQVKYAGLYAHDNTCRASLRVMGAINRLTPSNGTQKMRLSIFSCILQGMNLS
jgi:hypothetical protein